jgi:Fis family transcriptional regulator
VIKATENELSVCVRKTIERYFKDLDGEKPSAVHDMVIKSVEKPLIEIVLQRTKGNQTHAAQILGVNRNTLRSKMKTYGIK